MHVLVRIYIPNRDKVNIELPTLHDGLKLLNRTEKDIYSRVKWGNCEDIFLVDTKDYIRIINIT